MRLYDPRKVFPGPLESSLSVETTAFKVFGTKKIETIRTQWTLNNSYTSFWGFDRKHRVRPLGSIDRASSQRNPPQRQGFEHHTAQESAASWTIASAPRRGGLHARKENGPAFGSSQPRSILGQKFCRAWMIFWQCWSFAENLECGEPWTITATVHFVQPRCSKDHQTRYAMVCLNYTMYLYSPGIYMPL